VAASYDDCLFISDNLAPETRLALFGRPVNNDVSVRIKQVPKARIEPCAVNVGVGWYCLRDAEDLAELGHVAPRLTRLDWLLPRAVSALGGGNPLVSDLAASVAHSVRELGDPLFQVAPAPLHQFR
jgi:hypothetical protein